MKSNKSQAFVMWLAHAKRQSLEDRYDTMSHLITTMWFKQKVFLAMKLAVLNSQSEHEIVKFKAWKSWCENSRKNKYFDKKELLVEKIEGTRTEMLLKRVFDSIRYSNVNDKFEATRQELEDKIPIR
jgi:rRNA maturation endonuclease Nob1